MMSTTKTMTTCTRFRVSRWRALPHALARVGGMSPSRGWARSLALLALLCAFPRVAAASDSPPVGTSEDSLPVPLPTSVRCPWLSRGVVDAARESPLVRALVQRTRMAAPFGPGSWPERFTVPEPGDGPVFGWTDAVVFSATVRIDPKRTEGWLPRPLLRVANDTARVFVAWYERERAENPALTTTRARHQPFTPPRTLSSPNTQVP